MAHKVKDKALSGFIVAILAAEGVDDGEIRELVEWLHEQGSIVHPVSIEKKPFKSNKGGIVNPRVAAKEASGSYYDAVFIPGGEESIKALSKSEDALNFLRRVRAQRRNIAVLGDSARVILASGLAKDQTLAAPQALASEIKQAGATRSSDDVFASGFLLSAQNSGSFRKLAQLCAFECAQTRYHDDVDDALRATFPASDAPSSGPAI